MSRDLMISPNYELIDPRMGRSLEQARLANETLVRLADYIADVAASGVREADILIGMAELSGRLKPERRASCEQAVQEFLAQLRWVYRETGRDIAGLLLPE